MFWAGRDRRIDIESRHAVEDLASDALERMQDAENRVDEVHDHINDADGVISACQDMIGVTIQKTRILLRQTDPVAPNPANLLPFDRPDRALAETRVASTMTALGETTRLLAREPGWTRYLIRGRCVPRIVFRRRTRSSSTRGGSVTTRTQRRRRGGRGGGC